MEGTEKKRKHLFSSNTVIFRYNQGQQRSEVHQVIKLEMKIKSEFN